MSVVNLPGLWDQIGPSAMSFAENLQRAVAPNFYAKKKLEEMVQKDPTMVAKVANMGREEQASLAHALGFRNENPFEALPVGLERTEKVQDMGLKSEALASDKAGVAQRMFGARPKEQIQVDALKPKMAEVDLANSVLQGKQAEKNLLLSDQSLSLNGMKIEQAELDMAEQRRLKKLFPTLANVDLGDLAESVVMGKPVNNDLLAAIETSQFKDTFREYVQSRKQRLAISAEKAMRQAKTPSDLAQAMGVMKSIYDKSHSDYIMAQKDLDKFDSENSMIAGGETKLGKQLAADRLAKVKVVNDLKTAAKTDEQGMRIAFKLMTGKELPELTDIQSPPPDGSILNPALASVVSAIKGGSGTIEQARTAKKADGSPRFTPEELAQIEAQLKQK